MELEAITRQEQIIAGKDLQPVTRMEFFLKAYGGGGSGGGVQSDLSQNDSTAADYVKNRTHYEESIHTDYVLNAGGTQITGFSMPEVGETVTVKINGVESVETVKTDTSSVLGESYKYIGNIKFDSVMSGGTGWIVAESMGHAMGVANPATTITVGNIVVHKLDAKYLPESVFKIDGEILFDEENGTYTLPDGIEHGMSMIGKRFVASNQLVYINAMSGDLVPVFLTDYTYNVNGSLSCSVTCLLLAANGTYTAVKGNLAIT